MNLSMRSLKFEREKIDNKLQCITFQFIEYNVKLIHESAINALDFLFSRMYKIRMKLPFRIVRRSKTIFRVDGYTIITIK